MPSQVCCGESCPVTRSPSCARLHRQTGEPLPPPTCVVSSSTYLCDWTDHGAVTATNGANTTKMRWQHRQKDLTNERSGHCHFGRFGGCPKASKKKSQNSKSRSVFLWSHHPVGHKVKSSRPSAGTCPTSLHARDGVEQRPPVRNPACNLSSNHLQYQRSTTDKQ